jgi:hypothetical protein
MEKAFAGMKWDQSGPHPVKSKRLYLRTSTPTSEFWEAYRGLRNEWSLVGITVSKRGQRWVVRWWSDDSATFTVREPPKTRHT